MDDATLAAWVGRSEKAHDIASAAQAAGLAALLDHVSPPWRSGVVPPLGHWLQFAPQAPQSQLDPDGHPRRGGLLPPIALPRRMWAGSRLRFFADAAFGAQLERRSTVTAAVRKHGRSGEIVFVTVTHEITADGVAMLHEEQDIVYRAAAGGAEAPATAAPPLVEAGHRFMPDPTLLFRYSALSFNAHRIHYDRDYARDIEGYPGLVVQGPLIATLLLDRYLRAHPGVALASFEFRALSPLFDTSPFFVSTIETSGDTRLQAHSHGHQLAMTATLA